MMTSLVAMYQKGAITADHLAVECLHIIDPKAPALVLDPLPREVIMRMIEFTRQYIPGGMVTNYGILPALDQVQAAKKWIEENRMHEIHGLEPERNDWDNDQSGLPVPDPVGPGQSPRPSSPSPRPAGSKASRLG
jgi:hypothetical protein